MGFAALPLAISGGSGHTDVMTDVDGIDITLGLRLATALGVGLLIGLERGWRDRDAAEGSRPAGLRSFALIGLLGGVLALVGDRFGQPWLPGLGVLGLAWILGFAYRSRAEATGDLGLTTMIAGLLTLALGALAGLGQGAIATGGAVATAVLLGAKAPLHRALAAISPHDARAALRLAVITLLVLPLLPDRGYGPYDSLNPYRLWLAVVLLSGLSFAGYLLAKGLGAARGALVTGLAGGLVSSTAITAAFAAAAQSQPTRVGALIGGALAANAVMLVRLIVLAAVLMPQTLASLSAPIVGALLVLALAVWWHGRNNGAPPPAADGAALENPVDLWAAIKFALFMAVVALGSRFAQDMLGTQGMLVAAGVSGLADVDAIAVALAQAVDQGATDPALAATALLVAAGANTAVKAGLALTLGPRRFGLTLAGVLAAGAAVALVLVFAIPPIWP